MNVCCDATFKLFVVLISSFGPKCSFRDPSHHDLMGKQTAGWVKSQQDLLLFGRPLPRGKDGDKQRREGG